MLKNHVPFIYFMVYNQSGIRRKLYTISDIFDMVEHFKHDKADYTVEVYIDDTLKGLYILGEYATLVPKVEPYYERAIARSKTFP